MPRAPLSQRLAPIATIVALLAVATLAPAAFSGQRAAPAAGEVPASRTEACQACVEDCLGEALAGLPDRGLLGVILRGGESAEHPVTVVAVDPGGPAEQAGLRAGDQVTAIAGESGASLTEARLNQVVSALRPGRQVVISVLRGGRRLDFDVTPAAMSRDQLAHYVGMRVIQLYGERLGLGG